jgi:hypothetical protein
MKSHTRIDEITFLAQFPNLEKTLLELDYAGAIAAESA